MASKTYGPFASKTYVDTQDSGINVSLANETTRAKAAEEDLDTRITHIENVSYAIDANGNLTFSYAGNTSDEIERLTEKDSAIDELLRDIAEACDGTASSDSKISTIENLITSYLDSISVSEAEA